MVVRSSPFTRRDFLKTGSATLVLPAFLKGLPLAAATAPQKASAHHFARFGVDDALIRRVMSAALSKGGDYCDLFFQHTLSTTLALEDQAVNRAYSNVDLGVGIRVLKGDQVGYSFSENLDPKALEQAALTAAAIATSGTGAVPKGFRVAQVPSRYPVQVAFDTVDASRKVALVQNLNDRVSKADNRLVHRSAFYNDEVSHVLIVTSEGVKAYDFRPMVQFGASCVAEVKGRREQNGYSLSNRAGFEFCTPARVDEIAKEAVERTIRLFDAVQPQGGEMPLVLAPGLSGILLHEAIGHGLEADFNRKNLSIFSDKIGKKVAEPFVTVVDDGTQPHNRGAVNVDDEGHEGRLTALVEKGTLVSYMHDRISAAHYKVAPTGNGRRQDFRFAPVPRMRSTYMLPGPHTRDEIIASVKKGLYAEDFSNGEVNIGPGDFTFYVTSGYLIEDGRLTRPVKDVNIIGNGPEALSRITMVADDLRHHVGGGTCGKDGQGVPVGMGLPTIKISAITVGGVQA